MLAKTSTKWKFALPIMMLIHFGSNGHPVLAEDPPVLTTIVVTPASATLVVGDDEVFTATGKDQYGNDCPIREPKWTTTGGGTISPNGNQCTYTATDVGDYTIKCRESDVPTIYGTASIHTTNEPPVLTTIVVTPASATLVVGDDEVFTATGKDQYGKTYPISSPVWTTSGDGTLTPSGTSRLFKITSTGGGSLIADSTTCTYTATQTGDHTLVCREEGTAIQGTAAIHVTGTGVGIADPMPSEFALAQNHPNPFNPSTEIRFDVKEPCRVVLKVFDLRGCETSTLADANYSSGSHATRFDASGLPSGIYIYRIRMGNYTASRKMALMK